ncbi:cytoplasmic dynein 2 intermediate chain 1 [Channa argus]|uniref:cytoplasmic dynein 2 intermediate chain 1 n=1 Tax=Channa argus TaxID=215402 RepID=UPI002946F2AC|nr:hypothetical protein Q8A73_020520 [Channa argus]
MHSGKKITKEDTWKPTDLKKHIREGGHTDDSYRRQGSNEREPRSGESKDKQRKDPEKESRRERDQHREQEGTRDREAGDRKDKYVERRKEVSWDRGGDREKDRRDERDSEKRGERERLVDENKYSDDYREKIKRRGGRERLVDENKYGDENRQNRDSVMDREDKQDVDRDKERHRVKEKDRVRDRERHNEEDRGKRREERDKEKRRPERDREHRTEKRRHEESREGGKSGIEKSDREQRDRHRERDRHKDQYEDKTNEMARHKRHDERKYSEQKEQREYREHRTHKEERERRHKERENRDDKWKHDSESMKKQDLKVSVEEVRHRHGDRQRAERDKDKRHREGEDAEKKQRERRHREREDAENKHRERSQREEEEPEQNHRDRTSSKKSSSDIGHRHETNTAETEVVTDEDLGEQEYEGDFEDYEEDFEEVDESADEGEDEKEPQPLQGGEHREELTLQRRKEIEAIQRAMDEENERVETAQPRQSKEAEDVPKSSRTSETKQDRGSQRGKFIDFVAARQHEISKKVATKQKKRSRELLRLIDLDFSITFSLLDLPPVNEYDMYIRNFGSANTKQAYVQCNEDNTDRDVQTEEIELCEKWTQHPPEHSGACGDPNLSQEARNKTISELNFDVKRLTAFLSSASQVMVVLLEENQAERKSLRELRTQTDTLSFSEGSLQLNTNLPFLYGRHISLVHFSQVQRQTMMSVHMPTTEPSAVRLDSYSIICIWNIWEPSRPQKVLVYESEVQCCCFSPGKATLVFGGTSVGSVVLWDLREHASNHYQLKIGEDEWTFRQPSFSTDAVMADSGHFSGVTSVEVVPSVAGGLRPEVPMFASEEESSGLSFQLASLDECGVLNFWVVVELPKANEAGSQTDLGLRPGSKVKLLHSSSLHTVDSASPRDALKTVNLQTLHLKFLPTDSSHFFIGTNMGLVNHGTSHGLKAPPNFYRFQEPGVRPVHVSSIHFSPFRQNMFLVGCGDGSIRLHGLRHEQPVAEWKSSIAGEPVVSLQWALTRPTVFCVLDAASNLHIWDLLKNETEPVVTERMNADRVTAMAVFGDSAQQNIYSGIALAHESGKIEMHYFTRHFTLPISEEEEKLESMMTEAFCNTE